MAEMVVQAVVVLRHHLQSPYNSTATQLFRDDMESNGSVINGNLRQNISFAIHMVPVQNPGLNFHGANAGYHGDELKMYFFMQGAVSWQWHQCH